MVVLSVNLVLMQDKFCVIIIIVIVTSTLLLTAPLTSPAININSGGVDKCLTNRLHFHCYAKKNPPRVFFFNFCYLI